MQTTQYHVQGLDSPAFILDLKNSITLLDGVAHVDVDTSTRMLTVDYDPDYMDLHTLKYYIEGTGYPVTEAAG